MSDGSQVLQRLRYATGRRLAQICLGLAAALLVGALTGQVGVKPAFAYVPCTPGWQYDVITNYGSVHDANSGPYFRNYNGGVGNAVMTVTSTTSGSVGVTVTVSGTFNIGAIIAGAQVTTSVALTGTVHWSTGNSFTFYIPPRRYGNAIYGAWRLKTYGHYYYLSDHCGVSSSQYLITYVPENASGWRTWISTT